MRIILSIYHDKCIVHVLYYNNCSESPDLILKANIPILVGRVPSGWTVSLVDNPGFGEAKEHITRLAKVSMKISSAYIYLLETGSVGGEEAAKFFRKLMKRESLSCNVIL